MTDIKPHVSAWKTIAAKSASLGYISEPVDATNPPAAVISGRADMLQNEDSDQAKRPIFRLYCLSFHHFDDEMAKRVLKSTFETADAFAIIELQDRRFWSFVIMLLNFFIVIFGSPIWFWNDPTHLALTYIIPVLPLIMVFDGTVSSLRTREFRELMELVDVVLNEPNESQSSLKGEMKHNGQLGSYSTTRGAWVFENGREMHTFPFGFMNWVVGYKVSD
jgi:hypothetical protein